ncbi:class I SAM-dependent methyltransferase [Nonomuraea angiospora]|uniref:class I SAM-dependent methyltransferase n=1 Tax=Nonomuraea angiospora TaxID=46172 RepID=UPI0033EFC890
MHAALGQGRTVINVGAGSYEPEDRHVVAVEPSAAMRAQRPRHLAPALDGIAERLPFDDDSFDAAMATVTVHQWNDTEQGLRELRRVSRGPVVILTFDGDALDLLWLAEYAPELIAAERRRYPPIDLIASLVGARTEVLPVAIPSTAWTASPRRTTPVRNASSTRRSARPSRPGGSSTTTPRRGPSTGCGVTSTAAPGTTASVTYASSPSSSARSGS